MSLATYKGSLRCGSNPSRIYARAIVSPFQPLPQDSEMLFLFSSYFLKYRFSVLKTQSEDVTFIYDLCQENWPFPSLCSHYIRLDIYFYISKSGQLLLYILAYVFNLPSCATHTCTVSSLQAESTSYLCTSMPRLTHCSTYFCGRKESAILPMH